MNKKHLKKATIAILLSTMIAANAMAQNAKHAAKKEKPEMDTYFKAGASYAFNHGGMVGYAGASDITISKFEVKRQPTSFSAGLYANIGFGVLFGKHVGAELGLNMGIANRKYDYNELVYATGSNSVSFNYKASYTSRAAGLVLASPAIVVQSGGEKVNIYSRMGVSVPLMNRMEITALLTADGKPNLNIVQVYSMRTAVGFNGAAGISVSAGKHTDLWCEASMLSFTPYLKEGEITSYREGGVEAVQMLSENDRRTLFVFSDNSKLPHTTNEPEVRVTEAMSYSNFGIAVGFTFHM